MSGTAAGAAKARKRIIEKYGVDEEGKSLFFKAIGENGGLVSKGGGFSSDKIGKDGLTGRERARIAGAIGGKASRRKKV